MVWFDKLIKEFKVRYEFVICEDKVDIDIK